MRITARTVLFILLLASAARGGWAAEPAASSAPPVAHAVVAGVVQDRHGNPVPEAQVSIAVDGVPLHMAIKGERHGPATSSSGGFYLEFPMEKEPGESAIDLSITRPGWRGVEHLALGPLAPAGAASDGLPLYSVNKRIVMDRAAGPAFYITAAVLVLIYVIIALDLVHRTLAAMTGAVAVLFITHTAGVANSQYQIITWGQAMAKVDFNVIFLLLGMMIIVGVMRDTGVFQWLAYQAFRAAKGNIFRLATIFMVVTAVVSAFLDNVTTMLLLTPITIEIAVMLGISPVALLMPEVLASNIGGTATLIGDPPNIMIGSYTGLTFNDFMFTLTPLIVIIMVVHIFMMRWVYRKEYMAARVTHAAELEERLRETCRIRDGRLLGISLVVLTGVVAFFLLHGVLHMEPSIPALGGAALLLYATQENLMGHLEKSIEWSTLVFFIMLFIIIGACEEVGLIQVIADWVLGLSGGSLTLSVLLILFVSAIASGIVDNIPYTATMMPVAAFLSENLPAGQDPNVLWWALALGACLGGNATIVGASANVVTSGLSEKANYPIGFVYFMKIGVPVTLMSVAISAVYLLLFHI